MLADEREALLAERHAGVVHGIIVVGNQIGPFRRVDAAAGLDVGFLRVGGLEDSGGALQPLATPSVDLIVNAEDEGRPALLFGVFDLVAKQFAELPDPFGILEVLVRTLAVAGDPAHSIVRLDADKVGPAIVAVHEKRGRHAHADLLEDLEETVELAHAHLELPRLLVERYSGPGDAIGD